MSTKTLIQFAEEHSNILCHAECLVSQVVKQSLEYSIVPAPLIFVTDADGRLSAIWTEKTSEEWLEIIKTSSILALLKMDSGN